ncbi:MAG: hypothetical protein KC620_15225, partial [Myxococcales bacterium]|nr:hypothetical protein [Myxococcales bacterium]
MAQRFAVFAGLICSLLTVHCTDVSSSGNSCTLNTDCPLPEVCIENRCRLECRIDSDCADGERCLDSVCVDPFADCLSDADCREFGLICDVITRRCRPPGGADAARPDAAEPAD